MNQWKDELRRAFDAPRPVKKADFLRRLNWPGMHAGDFLLSQIGYIRKWVWCVSALIFVVSVLGFAFLPDIVLWLISGLTPLLALTVISESGRSSLYRMDELEMAARFSLRSVVFARLVILGLLDLLTIGILLLIGLWSNTSIPFAAGLYIITPFLLTSFAGLCIVRRYRGQEAMAVCVAVSSGISIALFFSRHVIAFIYQEQYLAVWLMAALLLLFGNGRQCAAMLKQTEELVWN